MKLAYVSDLALRPSGGGSYAVNWHACQQLERHFPGMTTHVIEPRVNPWEARWSQFQRKVLGRPGAFAYFSPRTSRQNAERVSAVLPTDADAVFFRSAARWRRCQPKRPYFIYLDVVFHTFFHNTFMEKDFQADDLRRIWDEEAQFLEGAQAVFFESKWGLERAVEAYDLKGQHYEALGRGGVIAPPPADTWDGETLQLLTIAMNFHQKGGDILLAAFDRLRQRLPNIRWSIIGGAPPDDRWRAFPEIEYVGKLRPENEAELARFRQLLANAFLLIHPTREDTNPLVLTEAAYFGCPTVSVRQFGIPELVIDGETGVLLDAPIRPETLAEAIERLAADQSGYREMRRRARSFALDHFTWDSLGQGLAKRIREAFSI